MKLLGHRGARRRHQAQFVPKNDLCDAVTIFSFLYWGHPTPTPSSNGKLRLKRTVLVGKVPKIVQNHQMPTPSHPIPSEGGGTAS